MADWWPQNVDVEANPEEPPINVRLMDWNLWPMPWRHSNANLAAMCEDGIRRVRTGRYEGVSFDLMKREIDFVRSYMERHAPEIPHNLKE